jgi:hypothetical protein
MKPCNRILLSALAAMLVPAAMASASTNPDLPSRNIQGSVVYLSGGGDPAQEAALRSEAARYPLEFDFLWGRGAKETPVNVVDWTIKDKAGHPLVVAPSGGPVVLASVPDGRYVVTARYEGKELSRTVAVRKGVRDTVVMEWPQ